MNDFFDDYIPWLPFKEWPKEIYFDSLSFAQGFLKICLKKMNSEEKVEIVFESCVAYMVSDENCHMKFMQKYSGGIFSIVYVVHNSGYIRYLHEQSYGIYENEDLIHIAIYTPIECIDVVTRKMPFVRWDEREFVA